MSTKQALLDFLDEVEYMIIKDIEASSEEFLIKTVGTTDRPPVQFLAEVGIFNSFTARYIQSPETIDPLTIESNAELEAVDTKRKANILVKKGFNDLRKAITNLEEADLTKTVTAQWGVPITIAHYILHALGHSMYHDGQLCQNQLIAGDDKLHWSGE
ncbi:hypothetical protein CCB80_06940 [Armatimonadetes bacterium Uphvl-Ar1]|nr:hypothetical protein CCB80_06940 [Armatimonadetes bacterium Uphvl-Ar1]